MPRTPDPDPPCRNMRSTPTLYRANAQTTIALAAASHPHPLDRHPKLKNCLDLKLRGLRQPRNGVRSNSPPALPVSCCAGLACDDGPCVQAHLDLGFRRHNAHTIEFDGAVLVIATATFDAVVIRGVSARVADACAVAWQRVPRLPNANDAVWTTGAATLPRCNCAPFDEQGTRQLLPPWARRPEQWANRPGIA